MNLKKITRTLSKIRKNVSDQGDISNADEDILRELLGTELSEFFDHESEQNNMPAIREANNDNNVLTKDQKYRLKLIEQSESTSYAIH